MVMDCIASSFNLVYLGKKRKGRPPSFWACGPSPPKHAHLFMMSPTQIIVKMDSLLLLILYAWQNFVFAIFNCLFSVSLFYLFWQGCCDQVLHDLSELGLQSLQFPIKTGPNMQTANKRLCKIYMILYIHYISKFLLWLSYCEVLLFKCS